MSRLWILSLCATIALVGGVSRGAVLANFDEPLGDSGWRVQGPSWCELQLAYEQEEVGGIDTVFITIYKTFRYGPDSFGRFPGIELSFRQMDGVPTEELATRIVIESEIIENATGSDWYDYHWKLFGCSAASFNQEMTNPTTDPDEEGWYIDPFTQADWIIDEVFGTEHAGRSGHRHRPGQRSVPAADHLWTMASPHPRAGHVSSGHARWCSRDAPTSQVVTDPPRRHIKPFFYWINEAPCSGASFMRPPNGTGCA